jgi:hypothetical protein
MTNDRKHKREEDLYICTCKKKKKVSELFDKCFMQANQDKEHHRLYQDLRCKEAVTRKDICEDELRKNPRSEVEGVYLIGLAIWLPIST